MRSKVPDQLEKARIEGPEGKYPGEFYGHFVLRLQDRTFQIRVSKGDPEIWVQSILPGPPFDHASVTVWTTNPQHGKLECVRCPTWEEMCYIKDLIWDLNECVLQYHPPHHSYINNQRYCLHLWKPVGVEVPIPPMCTI